MNDIHPAENILQQYAEDKSDCSPAILAHIESCAYCKAEVTTYRMLFSKIKEMPVPVFDFDITAIVIPKLPVLRPGLSADRFIAGFLVVFSFSCICIPVFLFWPYIKNMFSGISAFFFYAILISAAIILSIKVLDTYFKFQKQMRILNFN